MSTPGPTEPFGYGVTNGAPLPPRAPHDVWGHEHGEDPMHLLDASGHVRQHHDPLARLTEEPHVITSADRRRALVGQIVMVVLLMAAIAAALWWVLSET